MSVAIALLTALQGGIVPNSGSTTEVLLTLSTRLLGLTVASATVAGLAALAYRWYVRDRIPSGLAVLFGLTVVALYLGTRTALGEIIVGENEVLQARAVLGNLSAFAAGGFGSYGGIRVGDKLGSDLFVATGSRNVEADVSEIVQTVGRVTSVKLPDDIDDIVGYDPMPEATKETLAGRRFLFPRRLTKAELRDRLVSRLKTDYGVGHVDLELTDDGTVEFLAIGSRAAGIGPTLPPATSAVAIRADPANAASAGDLVQVWETEPLQRILTGELRGVAGEVVTVAIDTADTPKLDPRTQYKLVTLPVQDRPDREFASLLRAADETMGTVTVEAGSTLDGTTVGSLSVTVAAITRDDKPPVTIPDRGQILEAGDVLYLIATPDALRRLEADAVGSADAISQESNGDESEPTATAESTDVDRDSGSAASSAIPEAERSERDETAVDDDSTDERANTGDEAEERTTDRDDVEEATSTESDEVEIPDSDAFPDTADLPGTGPDDADGPQAVADDDKEAADSDDTTESAQETADVPDEVDGADQSKDGSADGELDETAGEPDEEAIEREPVPESADESTDDLLDPLSEQDDGDEIDIDDLLTTGGTSEDESTEKSDDGGEFETSESDGDVTVWDPDERIEEANDDVEGSADEDDGDDEEAASRDSDDDSSQKE